MKKKRRMEAAAALLAVSILAFAGCSGSTVVLEKSEAGKAQYDTVADVPAYNGEPYVELNGNEPEFTEAELTTEVYEDYSELDDLGRCGEAEACIGEELMPDTERESISQVKPTGWVNEKYDSVDGGYLYNRCHLIGYQLSGENANEQNLITGTRYMNTEGMLPFEDMVADYVHETDNHVMYRVTPVFEGDDLVASGVIMEAESVEDDGEGVCFHVYVYNVQPDIVIDYANGENWETEDGGSFSGTMTGEQTYMLNTNTKKFHLPDWSGVRNSKEKNREEYTGTREEILKQGYEPCGRCHP